MSALLCVYLCSSIEPWTEIVKIINMTLSVFFGRYQGDRSHLTFRIKKWSWALRRWWPLLYRVWLTYFPLFYTQMCSCLYTWRSHYHIANKKKGFKSNFYTLCQTFCKPICNSSFSQFKVWWRSQLSIEYFSLTASVWPNICLAPSIYLSPTMLI